MIKKTSHWKNIVKNTTFEITALLALAAGFGIVLFHIDTAGWKDFIFANSDITTLSLVWHSLAIDEPFRWVFSSQIFLFPELPIYTVASLFSDNFKDTLIINALFNILLLYVALRLLMRVLSRSKVVNISLATLLSAGILGILAIEDRTGANVAMYFMVTTAYYGVILSGILTLSATLLFLKWSHIASRVLFNRVLLAGIFFVSLFTGVSNPLFFLQVTAPMLGVLVLLLIIKSLSKKAFWQLSITYIASVIGSMVIRKVFLNDYFSPLGDITNYFHFTAIPAAIKTYIGIVQQMVLGNMAQKIELLIIIVVVIGALMVFFTTLRAKLAARKKHAAAKQSDYSFFLIAFGCLAPIATIVGTIATGNPTTRYLLPVIFFTPLAFIPLFIPLGTRYKKHIIIGFFSLAALMLTGALISQSTKHLDNLRTYYPPSAQCLDTQLAGTPYKAGVAQFWRARGLQLNSQDGHVVEQVHPTIDRFNWLYNSATYTLHDLSFVVVDKPELVENPEISNHVAFTIQAGPVVELLGQPTAVYQCMDFDIYTYDDTNPGKRILNDRIRNIPLQ